MSTSAAPVTHNLPPLPRLSPPMLDKVYAHKGLFSAGYILGQSYLQEPKDNERLTWLGAATLQLCVGKRLYDYYPMKQVGFLTQERGLLVSNHTLAEWAHAYDMPRHLRGHISAIDGLRRNAKVAANTFEAYVGAVFEHAGIDAVQIWIDGLVDAQLERAEQEPPSSPGQTGTAAQPEPAPGPSQFMPAGTANQLSILNERAAQQGKKITWDEESFGPQHSRSWKAILMIDGKVVAERTGDKKQTAKLAAAAQAINELGWS